MRIPSRPDLFLPLQITMGVCRREADPQRFSIMADLRRADEPVEMVLHRDRNRKSSPAAGLPPDPRVYVSVELCAGRLGGL